MLAQLRVDFIFESADLSDCVIELCGDGLELLAQLRVTWQVIEFFWVGAQTYLEIVDIEVVACS